MSDTEDFVSEMTRNIGSGESRDSAMRFIEEVSTTPASQMSSKVEELNKALTEKSLPSVYLVQDEDDILKEAWLDDGTFYDTPLYKRPKMPYGIPDRDSLERLSDHLEAVEQLGKENPNLRQGRAGFKRAADFLVQRALELPDEDRNAVLQRASDASYVSGHSLNVVFADLDGDGKRNDLSDVALTYSQRVIPNRILIERIDLYDPPVRRDAANK
jgi:hypothetical protein